MWGIIINPKSGKKALRRQRKFLFQTLKLNQIKFDYKVTQYAGHASEIARNFVENGIEKLLVLGGDGTMSEVINGVFSAKIATTGNITFALIPRGTGNDWGRYWGLTRDYKKSIDVFLHGRLQPIDIGQLTFERNGEIHKHFFINSVGFGIDQKVVQLTHTLKYYFGSHALLYFISLVAAVFRHQPQKLKITTSNGFSYIGKVFTMNIGNGCFSGGGMKQNPDANPTDGTFHAMFVQRPTFRDILAVLPRMFNGTLMQYPKIHPICADNIQLYTHKYLPFEADGILVDACGPYTVSVIPNAIQMIVPQ